MRVLDGKSGWLDQIVISPDNKRLAARDSKGSGLRQFDLSDGSLRNGYEHKLRTLCFFPDQDQILLALDDILLRVGWETGRRDADYPRGGDPNEIPASRVRQMLVSPAGELVTLGMDDDYENYLVSRWKAGKGGEIKRVSEAKLDGTNYRDAALSQDGSKLVAAFKMQTHEEPYAAVLAVPKFKTLGTFARPTDYGPRAIREVLVSPGGDRIVSCEEGRFLYAWDGPGGAGRRIKTGGRRELTGLAFHPSGARLAVASNDETVRVFDTATWEEVSKFTWKAGRLRGVAYSPDGTLAAAGSDTGKVVVWDVDE